MACGCKKKNTQSETTQGTPTEGTAAPTTEQTQPTQDEVVQISTQLREMIEKKTL